MSEGGYIIPVPGRTWLNWVQVGTLEEVYEIMMDARRNGKMIGCMKLRIEGEEDG